MKHINRTDLGEPVNESSWPKHSTKTVETRKRDLVIRIADWTRDREEPAYDVEVYIRGVYDWNESKTFTKWVAGTQPKRTKEQIRKLAIEFAQAQIAKHLK